MHTHMGLRPKQTEGKKRGRKGSFVPIGYTGRDPSPALTKPQRLSLRCQVLSQPFIQEQSGLTRELL